MLSIALCLSLLTFHESFADDFENQNVQGESIERI